jgi:tRNA(fMet)-specific endonuclease VapC
MYCLDTDTCIDALKGRSPALSERFRTVTPARIKIPSLVLAELLFGAARSARPEENREWVERFVAPFEILPFGIEAAREYGHIREFLEKAGRGIGPNDTIVASIVQSVRGVLVTRNIREFRRVPGLQVESWTA